MFAQRYEDIYERVFEVCSENNIDICYALFPPGTIVYGYPIDVGTLEVDEDDDGDIDRIYIAKSNNTEEVYFVPNNKHTEFKSFATATKLNAGRRLDNAGGDGVEICEQDTPSTTCHTIGGEVVCDAPSKKGGPQVCSPPGPTVEICGCDDACATVADARDGEEENSV